jgi:hypothetical protein
LEPSCKSIRSRAEWGAIAPSRVLIKKGISAQGYYILRRFWCPGKKSSGTLLYAGCAFPAFSTSDCQVCYVKKSLLFLETSIVRRRAGCAKVVIRKPDKICVQISSFHGKHGFQGNTSLAAVDDFYSDQRRVDDNPKVLQAVGTLQYLLDSYSQVQSSYLNLVHRVRARGTRGVLDACLRAFAHWAEGIPKEPAVEALHHAKQMMDEASEELTPLILRLMDGFNNERLEKAAWVMLGKAELGLRGKERRKPQKVGDWKGSQQEPEPVSWAPTAKGARGETSERRPDFTDSGACLTPKAGSERMGSQNLEKQFLPQRGVDSPRKPRLQECGVFILFRGRFGVL